MTRLPVKRPSRVRRSLKRLLCELFTKVVTLAGLPLRLRRFKVTLWLTGKRVLMIKNKAGLPAVPVRFASACGVVKQPFLS